MSAEYMSNVQPFNGNGDVSIWMKNFQVGRKTSDKLKNLTLHRQLMTSHTVSRRRIVLPNENVFFGWLLG